jgi:zinc transport system ATP-binding protein
MKEPILEAKNLSFAYGAKKILEDVSLAIEHGEIIGLIGPNGSGKTTLLRLFLGLLPLQSGEIRLFGQALKDFREWTRVGYVRQRVWDFERNFPASVEEIVATGRVPHARLFRPFGRLDREALEQALDALEIRDLRYRPLSELSGGQQQRVFLARVLAQEPEVLLLDEPTTAVDLKAEAEFYELLAMLNRVRGLTIVLVSHDIETIATQVTKIVCLNHQLLFCGAPEECLKSGVLDQAYEGKHVLHHGHHWGGHKSQHGEA